MLAAFRIPILSGLFLSPWSSQCPIDRYGWTRTPTQRGLSPNLGLLSFFVLCTLSLHCLSLTFYPLCFDPFLVHYEQVCMSACYSKTPGGAARRLLTIWKSEFREDEAFFCAMKNCYCKPYLDSWIWFRAGESLPVPGSQNNKTNSHSSSSRVNVHVQVQHQNSKLR